MNISGSKAALCLMLTMLFCCIGFLSVSAQESQLTDQQIKNITSNCSTTKNYINQIHTSDALSRVNSGQIYDSILNKLMDKFNSRIANNNFENVDLTNVTKRYETALNTFRSDYITYERRLSSAIAIDCEKKPTEFYYAVISTREARIKVHDDVVLLNQLIDEYDNAVLKFEADYKSVVDGIKR